MKSERTPELQLVSSSTTLLPEPARGASPWIGVAVSLVCLGLGAAWYAWSQAGLERGLDRLDERALLTASAAFRRTLDHDLRALEAQAHALVDDARIRTTLATPGIDAATIEDVLADLKKATGQAAYAVLDTRGVVRAVVGADALRGADLGAASVVQKARAGQPASAVWSLSDGLMVLAVAPVRLGEVSAYFLVGSALTPEALGADDTVGAGVVVGDRVVVGVSSPALVQAAGAPLGTPQVAPGSAPPRVTLAVAIGEGPGSAVGVWTVARHHAREALGAGAVGWPALAILGLCAAGAAASALARARGSL